MGTKIWVRTIALAGLTLVLAAILPAMLFAGENNTVYLGYGFGPWDGFQHPEGNDLGTPKCIGANLDCMFDNTNYVIELNTSFIGIGYRNQKIDTNYEDKDTGEFSEVTVTNRFYTINLFPYTMENGIDWVVILGQGQTTIDFKVFRNAVGGFSSPQETPSRIFGFFLEKSTRDTAGSLYQPLIIARIGFIVVDSDPLVLENGFVFDASGSAPMIEIGVGF